MAADHAGLDADPLPALLHLHLSPVPGHLHQDPVGDRLPRQACPGRPEGEGDAVRVAEAEEGPDLVDVLGQHHGLRDEPVKARIRGVGDAVDRPGEDPLPLDDPGEAFHEARRGEGDRGRRGGSGHT